MSNSIGFLGMSPSGSTYHGEFLLADGRTGSVVDEHDTFRVGVDGLAARYSQEELAQIGNGNPIEGEVAVITSVVNDPEGFQFDCTKPAAPLEVGQLVIAGTVLASARALPTAE
jgi:hypothetical protein